MAAHVEAETDLAGDLAESMLRRIGEKLAGREGEIVAFALEPLPLGIERQHKFRSGDDRVMPVAARYRAGMTVLAQHAGVTVAEAAADAGDECDWNLPALEHRPLLDMQLDVTPQLLRRSVDDNQAHGVRNETTLPKMLRERAAGIHPGDVEHGRGKQTKRRFRSNIGVRKPGAFLSANDDDGNIAGRSKLVFSP